MAGRGASAGAYSHSRSFDLCFPSRGEPVGAGLLPGRPGERPLSCSLRPAPQVAARPGAPQNRQPVGRGAQETPKWGPVLVRRVTFLFSPLAGLGPLPAPRPSPGPSCQANCLEIHWTPRLRNGVTDDVERSQPSSPFCPLPPRKSTPPRQPQAIFRAPQARVWEQPQRKRGGTPTANLRVQAWPRGGEVTPVFTELRVPDPPCCQASCFFSPE